MSHLQEEIPYQELASQTIQGSSLVFPSLTRLTHLCVPREPPRPFLPLLPTLHWELLEVGLGHLGFQILARWLHMAGPGENSLSNE